MQKEYHNHITHLKEVVSQMNAEEEGNKKLTLEIDLNEKLPDESNIRYNLGYAVIMKIYHELELDYFLNNARHVDRINAHALTCFISLVILRLIQKKTDYKFTPEQIITCLNNIRCCLEHTNLYMFDYHSNISNCIGKAFGIDFTKKRLSLNKIKNILASSKKLKLCYAFMVNI